MNISARKNELYESIVMAYDSNELPSKKRAVFYTSVLKENAEYYEVMNSINKYCEATINVVYYINDKFPVMILEYNGKYQDFYYTSDNCWNILSKTNPNVTWKSKKLNVSTPTFLIDNFAEGNLLGFFEDAEVL